jgi:tripartite-type tricarboxylate transporter receptor subunit TctC
VFQSPSAEQIYNISKEVEAGAGILYLYGNYTGDIMNFDMAAEMCDMDDIPTCTELGYEFVAGIHRGFAVTPGTPDDIVDYLEAKIKEVYDNPAFIEYMNDTLGFNTVWTGHDEYESLARELVENFRPLLETAANY